MRGDALEREPGAGGASVMRAGLPLVPLDESLCEQAFLNLVQNAYEAMQDNGGTLRIEVATLPRRAIAMECSLCWPIPGPGVPEKFARRSSILL